MRFPKPSRLKLASSLVLVSLLLLGVRPLLFHTSAATLPNRYIKMGSTTQGATTEYELGFEIATAATLGSIRFQFCSNSSIIGDACNAPVGLDMSTASLDSQTGETGFSISALSDQNTIILTRTPSLSVLVSSTYTLNNVVNPSATGSYFVRIETFASDDATGPNTDYGGLAFVINTNVNLNAVVPPFLLFCTAVTIAPYDCSTASGDYINLGILDSSASKSAQTQMLIATNAGGGYGVFVNGTTMSSGTDVIPPISSSDVSRPGTSQFGLNLVSNVSPNVGQNVLGPGVAAATNNYNDNNLFRFVNGDQIISSTTSDNYRLFTVSYLVNVANTQAPGTYVSTLTYICTATF